MFYSEFVIHIGGRQAGIPLPGVRRPRQPAVLVRARAGVGPGALQRLGLRLVPQPGLPLLRDLLLQAADAAQGGAPPAQAGLALVHLGLAAEAHQPPAAAESPVLR